MINYATLPAHEALFFAGLANIKEQCIKDWATLPKQQEGFLRLALTAVERDTRANHPKVFGEFICHMYNTYGR